MFTKLATERLSLDALSAEDGEFILELLNTKGWLRFIGDRNIDSKEDAINYINKDKHHTKLLLLDSAPYRYS